jgi:hypothetical protein
MRQGYRGGSSALKNDPLFEHQSRNRTKMNAQTVLWRAYRQGVTIRLNGEKGLRLSPANEAANDLTPAVREHKPELMALLADLEEAGAQDDPLILQALALFNATLRGCETRATLPFPAPVRPAIAFETRKATQGWLL